LDRTVGPSLLTKSDQVRSARESLERALLAAGRAGDELRNLRLRGQVDDETYKRKRLEILDRRARLQVQLGQAEVRPEVQLERLRRVRRFGVSAPKLFEDGADVLRRQIVETMTSNGRSKTEYHCT